MKIKIITSCTGEKKFNEHPCVLKKEDFQLLGTPDFVLREKTLWGYQLPAERLYTGQQHVRLMQGVQQFRDKFGDESVSLSILSAGYGLISGKKEIVSYECTFAGMKSKELKEWSNHLGVPNEIRQVLAQPADLALVLLGDDYLKACQLDDDVKLGAPTVFLCSPANAAKLADIPNLYPIALSNKEAKKCACPLIGLKGEVARRILMALADNGSVDLNKLTDSTILIG